MFIIEDRQLGPVSQREFFQDHAKIVSHRSFAEKQFMGDLLVVKAICHQLDQSIFFGG